MDKSRSRSLSYANRFRERTADVATTNRLPATHGADTDGAPVSADLNGTGAVWLVDADVDDRVAFFYHH